MFIEFVDVLSLFDLIVLVSDSDAAFQVTIQLVAKAIVEEDEAFAACIHFILPSFLRSP
jgi:hypothetical protein